MKGKNFCLTNCSFFPLNLKWDKLSVLSNQRLAAFTLKTQAYWAGGF